MVVLGHTLMYDSPVMLGVYKIIYSFHIPLFVFVSGYLFIDSQTRIQKEFVSIFINRFKRLIIPCFIVALLWIIPSHIFITRDLGSSFSEIWVKIIDILSGNVEHLWFLLMLFWTTIIFYPLSLFFKSKYAPFAIPLIGIVLAWIFVNTSLYTLPNFYSISQVSKYLFYFYMGAVLCEYREKIDVTIRGNPLLTVFILGLLVWNSQLYILANFDTYVGAWFIISHLKAYFVVSTITILFLYAVAVSIEHIFKTFFERSKVISFLDKESLGIYYFHIQMGTIVIPLINKIKFQLTVFNKICILFFSMILLSSIMIIVYRKIRMRLRHINRNSNTSIDLN